MPAARNGRLTPKTVAEWFSVVPQALGVLGLIFSTVFWALTGRIEPSLLTAFGGLIVVGQGAEAVSSLKAPRQNDDNGA